MAVDAAILAELRAMEAAAPANISDELLPLTTVPEVLAYTIAQARAQGEDEADMVELVIAASDMTPSAVRAARRVLARLGYAVVADRLREIAGKRPRR